MMDYSIVSRGRLELPTSTIHSGIQTDTFTNDLRYSHTNRPFSEMRIFFDFSISTFYNDSFGVISI